MQNTEVAARRTCHMAKDQRQIQRHATSY